MEIDRPAQRTQPSRKGKKAWRKHIDIDDIQEGLEESRKLERQYGTKDISKVKENELFTVDTAGDDHLKPKELKKVKPLKADEILARRSKVEPLVAPNKKADKPKTKAKGVEGVSGKEINRLMRVAGREGDSTTKASIEKDGMINTPAYDLWGDEEPEEKKSKSKKKRDLSFIDDINASAGNRKPSHAPKTISEAPLLLVDEDLARAVVTPEGGKSYNPDHEEWMKLLKKESEREQNREEERNKLAQEKQRIEELMEQYTKEIDEDDDDNEDDEEEEAVEENADNDSQLKSVNQPVRVKKKSNSQRRKRAQEKERQNLQIQLKNLKQQIKDLEALPKLIEQELARFKRQEEERKAKEGTRKKVKKLGKHAIKDAPLEVKLSDELTDTLRRLKPEGNLTAERFRSLQQRGLVEARVPVAKKRKYTPQVTEKWSYKDFK